MKSNSLWEDKNLDESECFCTPFIGDANGTYENCYKRDRKGKPWHAKLGTVVVSVGILRIFLLHPVLSF